MAKNAGALARRGLEVVLLDPGVFAYSGLATGVLGGMHPPELDQIDPKDLIERNGGVFHRDRAVAVDRAARAVRLDSGASLRYDALSLNVGSEVALERIGSVDASVWTLKPIPNLWRLRETLEARFREGAETRVVVVGGGATGCETAANVDALARRRGGRVHVTVVSADDRLIVEHPAGAARSLTRALRERGIELCLGCTIERIEARAAVASDGRRVPGDLLVAATGLRAPRWNRGLGLPLDGEDGIRVGATLQSVADERVFAVGDCARLEGHDLPKLGVFGVRQAPVLLHNLRALLEGKPLRAYQPQKHYLTILNLGRGEALAVRGSWYFRGRLALLWKDWLDRRFLERYRAQAGAGERARSSSARSG